MSSSQKKINSPVNVDESEKARIQSLIEKELDLEESILNEELSDNASEVGEQSKKVDEEKEKHLEDILLNDVGNKDLGDSDNQDENLELRWEDDLEEEATLLEDPIDKTNAENCIKDLTLQEDVTETSNEETFLDVLDEDSVPSSVADTPFVPKTAHGLNKPDMMLEIPTQAFFECSDDEGDQMTNLEMSPDEVLEVNNDNSKDIDEDILLGTDEENSNGNLKDSKVNEISDDKTKSVHERDSEAETKLAADIITKELNEQEESILLSDNYMDTAEIKDSGSKQTNEQKILQPSAETAQLDEEINEGEENKELLEFDDSQLSVPEGEIQRIKTEDMADEVSETSIEAMECEVENIKEKYVFPISSNIQIDPKSIEEGKNQNFTDTNIKEEMEETSLENNSVHDINIEVQGISKESQDQVFKNTLGKDKSNTNVSYQLPDSLHSTHSVAELQNTDMEISKPQPSTSYAVEKSNFSEDIKKDEDESVDNRDVKSNSPQPSTSFSIDNGNSMFGSSMVQNDVSEMSDSLGLLAESSKVVEDEEENEYDEYCDGDEDDEFDNGEDESNFQVTAENSEESNTQQLESDTMLGSYRSDKNSFGFTISGVTSETCNKKPDESNETVLEEKQNINESDVQEENLNEFKMEDDSKDTDKELSTDVYDTKDAKVDGDTESIVMNLPKDNDDSSKTSSEKVKETPDGPTTQDDVANIVDLDGISSNDVFEMLSRNAKNCKNYRNRKKLASLKIKKKPLTSAERCRMYRLRKKQLSQGIKPSENEVFYTPSTSNSRMTFEPSLQPVTTDIGSDQESTEVLSPSTDEDTTDNKDVRIETDKSPKQSDTELEEVRKEMESVNVSEDQKPQMDMEVYNLDTDEEDNKEEIGQPGIDIPRCVNQLCSRKSRNFYKASIQAVNFYGAKENERMYMCENCADAVEERGKELIAGIKNFSPLMELGFKKIREELVEISDSESEDEADFEDIKQPKIGESEATVIEEQLTAMFNEAWVKYKIDDRIAETQEAMRAEMLRIRKEGEALNKLINECQVVTDKLRNDVYLTFAPTRVELPTLMVFDTPNCSEKNNKDKAPVTLKRSRSPSKEIPSKRPAIPLGYTPLENKSTVIPVAPVEPVETKSINLDDDSADLSVVESPEESVPKDLPRVGELVFTPLKIGMTVYAMKNAISGSWLKARIVEIIPKNGPNSFTACRVKFEHNVTNHPFKTLPARHLAYYEPPDVRLNVGRRVIALFKDVNKREFFYSGIVAEFPNPVNSYRYLIFFDDGYAQYAPHKDIRLVCECSNIVWEEVQDSSREFLRKYILAYPERPMVRLHPGQHMKTEWRGKWLSSRVLRVDASLVEVEFLTITKREWIYRGSTRLAPLYLELKAAERHRPRAMPRSQPQSRSNMPYVEYTRSDEQNKTSDNQYQQTTTQQQNEELRRQRAVAKKSTSIPVQASTNTNTNLDTVCSRVVYYTPKNAVKPFKMVPHSCSPKCKRKDVLALKDLRTYNPLAKPLLSGWERQLVRWKCHKEVIYRAPCGRRLRNMRELHKYLSYIQSDMAVDLFDFSPNTHCLAEFVLNKCFVGKKDLSHGKENVPVPCVNYYDVSLPEFCSYNTERTPTAGVPLNLDPEFLCGCDCEDDCEDKTKCACWKMTLEGAKTIGLEGENVGYVYKRLPEPLPSGIYECNSRCKCKHTCLNRVAQHPLQLKLQVFKTANRGWGIRALNDIPKGAFLCVYAGNLLTDATANLDGLNEGDEYLAELDYIEVVEQMKEGYEEDIPEKIKKLDRQESVEQHSEEAEEEMSSEGESNNSIYDQEDDDFQPGYISNAVSEFNKRLRRRDSKKDKDEDNQKEKEKEKESEKKEKEEKEKNAEEVCITISDDEEVREPSCFTAAAGMGANEFVSKYRSVRTLFGEDEACYIMDAKVQGNIGRYLNHSCSPNVFVQNVFVDTHDPRFPWVAFFALSYIKSGTELTWNYNYDVGSVPGKSIVCKCGSVNCRGRLL